MRSIRLLDIDAHLREALAASPEAFEERYQVSLGDNRELIRQVVAQTLELCKQIPRAAAWGGFLVADAERSVVVGTCGYKHGPEQDGSVEIAYFTFPQFERQGYATSMAHELLRRGMESDEARTVVAHTLPERNASTRILVRLGFRHLGAVVDDEDGTIWRWVHP